MCNKGIITKTNKNVLQLPVKKVNGRVLFSLFALSNNYSGKKLQRTIQI